MAWLALPSRGRDPLYQEDFARDMGVNASTLWRWQKLPGFDAEVQAIIRASLGDVLNEVMGSFKDEAKKGEFAHVKMYFEMLGLYVPPAQKIDATVKLFDGFNTEDV